MSEAECETGWGDLSSGTGVCGEIAPPRSPAARAIDPPPPGEGRNADAAPTVAFGNACTDDELATVANYVTGRFGKKGSKLTAKDVAELRKQTAE